MDRFQVKIYYEDTDAGGVVYYANYLRYLERARTEYLASKGINVAFYHMKGILFAVVDLEIHYKKPAHLGDTIHVTTDVLSMSYTTIKLSHKIFREQTLIAEAKIRLACINPEGKPQKIPDDFLILKPS